MGIRLVVEVLDNAPEDLTPAERLLLVALAEDARDETRVCFPEKDKLARRTGLQEDGLRRTFQRLAKRGLEVRVPIGYGKDGRAVFARTGVRSTYRLPPLARRDDSATSNAEAVSESRLSGGTSVPPDPIQAVPASHLDADFQDGLFPAQEAGGKDHPSSEEAVSEYRPTPHPQQPEKKKTSSSSRSKKPKADTPPREDVEQLCGRLLEWAIKKEYHGRPKAVPDEWRTEARLLLDKDKVTLQDALDVLDWSQRDLFWRDNIHAMPKFRAKYGDLEIRSRGRRGDGAGQQRSTSRTSAPGANPNQFTEEDFNDPNFG
ncbi:unnamed protein product [[Actinomadura] parvosata subsp. kistnae]|nr:helix-turn-helix domain-containing protein [Nonomuraea sp. ATCC 55076]SPL94100.1 unnamed protein product [Actinomadura parvosata subsp. kistnae]